MCVRAVQANIGGTFGQPGGLVPSAQLGHFLELKANILRGAQSADAARGEEVL
jgi:hypothetical protein